MSATQKQRALDVAAQREGGSERISGIASHLSSDAETAEHSLSDYETWDPTQEAYSPPLALRTALRAASGDSCNASNPEFLAKQSRSARTRINIQRPADSNRQPLPSADGPGNAKTTTTASSADVGAAVAAGAVLSCRDPARDEIEACSILKAEVKQHHANRWKLEFDDFGLEAAFSIINHARVHRRVGNALVLVATIWALFGITDLVKNSEGLRREFEGVMILRAAGTSLGLVLAIAVWLGIAVDDLRLQMMVGLGLLMVGTCQVVFGVWEKNTLDPAYSVPMIIVTSLSSTLFHQRFKFSTVFSVLLLLIYIALTVIFDAYDDNVWDLVLTSLSLAATFVLLAFFALQQERTTRREFLMDQLLMCDELKSQQLLETMLPPSIATMLRSGVDYIYKRHKSVSVLFSHIDRFDAITEDLSALELVTLLNTLFSRFDSLTDKLGVYKVETIGDVFLTVTNCPDDYACEHHAALQLVLALQMQECVKQLQHKVAADPSHDSTADAAAIALPGDVTHRRGSSGGTAAAAKAAARAARAAKKGGTESVSVLQIKIGVHTGEVVAGVVGMKYPRFRLMGDCVNTASRMCTTGSGSSVQMSNATYKHARQSLHAMSPTGQRYADEIATSCRGPITVKGKGRMTVYLAHRPGAHPSRKDSPQFKSANNQPASPRPIIVSQHSMQRSATQPLSGGELSPPIVEITAHRGSLSASRSGAQLLSRPPAITVEHRGDPSQKHSHSHSHSASNNSQDSESAVLRARRRSRSKNFKEELRSMRELSKELTREEEQGGLAAVELASAGRTTAGSGSAHARARSVQLMFTGGPGGTALSPTLSPLSAPLPIDDTIGKEIMAAARQVAINAPLMPHFTDPKSSIGQYGVHTIGSEDDRALQRLYTLASEDSVIERQLWRGQLMFHSHKLEARFQLDIFAGMLHTNQLCMLLHTFFLALGSVYTYFRKDQDDNDADLDAWAWAWIPRGLGVLVGVVYLVYSRSGRLEELSQRDATALAEAAAEVRAQGLESGAGLVKADRMHEAARRLRQLSQETVARQGNVQLGSAVVATALAASWLWVRYILDDTQTAYAVGGLLIQLAMICLFYGLRFLYAMGSTVIVVALFGALAWARQGTLPGIIAMLSVTAILYLNSAYASEVRLRKDFVNEIKQEEEIRAVKRLLGSMLPAPIMKELSSSRKRRFFANEFQSGDVLFCDIVSFTSLAASMEPSHVVAVLNVVFSAFDALTDHHNVYKVETIGDAYLACSGVVIQSEEHTKHLVDCALDMQRISKQLRTPDRRPITVRIGIHTGYVVAGVVGKKMPRYHLFGETVTLAEHIEETGIPGSVVVSETTHASLQPADFPGSYKVYPMDALVLGCGRQIQRYEIKPGVLASLRSPVPPPRKSSSVSQSSASQLSVITRRLSGAGRERSNRSDPGNRTPVIHEAQELPDLPRVAEGQTGRERLQIHTGFPQAAATQPRRPHSGSVDSNCSVDV